MKAKYIISNTIKETSESLPHEDVSTYYSEKKAKELATKIDSNFIISFKKPRWCPMFLYYFICNNFTGVKIKEIKLPPTKRELEILNFIKDFKKKTGFFPTRKEMANEFNITSMGIQKFINNLEKKGYIKKSIKARDLEILK